MVISRHRIPVICHPGGRRSGKTSLLHAWAERAGQLRRAAPGLSSCPAAGCRAFPGPTLTRLRELKAVYDPQNVFNQNFPLDPVL
jgi:FAD/FMN-containing dehydrogenase